MKSTKKNSNEKFAIQNHSKHKNSATRNKKYATLIFANVGQGQSDRSDPSLNALLVKNLNVLSRKVIIKTEIGVK